MSDLITARALVVALALLFAAPVALGAPVPKGADDGKKLAVVYVHDADEKTAGAFKKFLDAEGFVVTLVAHGTAAKTDFTPFGLVVIGSDAETEEWAATAAVIEKSGKPVLALGEGGYTFFGRSGLKLDIGAPNGWHGSRAAVVAVDAATSAFWKTADVPAGKPVVLYNRTKNVGIHLPAPPANVVLLGREDDDDTHYAMVRQGDRYVFWGFTAGPDDMTADGRRVFVATCRYTAALARADGKK